MKTLANCKPSEFLSQTVKIKRAVEKWLNATEILEISKRKPVLTPNMTQKAKKNAVDRQSNANLSAIFDSCLERHPKETLSLLALLCFVEPEHVDDHTVDEYMAAINEMLGSDTVVGFFTSLMRLAQTGILKP